MPFDYGETVRDLKALVRQEARDGERTRLEKNIDTLDAEFRRISKQLQDLLMAGTKNIDAKVARAIADESVKVLTERVEWLVWMMRAVIIALGVEVIGGLTVALIMRGR